MPSRLRALLTEHIQNVKKERKKRIKSCKAFWMTFNEFYQLFCLGVGMTVYLVLGAAILTALEGGAEQMRIDAVSENQQRLIDNLTETFNASRSEVLHIFNEFHDSCERGLLLTRTVRMWDFGSALFFAITVVTTIGYGNIAPSTASGKTFCVFYALVGIPLCLILLALIGKVILWAMKFGYAFFSRMSVLARFVGLIAIAGLGLTFLGLVPAIIIGHIEQWDYAVSLYYTFVSCSTIGFGDLVAGQHDDRPSNVVVRNVYKVAVGVWLFLGLATLAIILSIIADAMKVVGKKMKHRALIAHKKVFVRVSLENKDLPSANSPSLSRTTDTRYEYKTSLRGEKTEDSGCEQVAAGDQPRFEQDHPAEILEKQAEITREEDTTALDVMSVNEQSVIVEVGQVVDPTIL